LRAEGLIVSRNRVKNWRERRVLVSVLVSRQRAVGGRESPPARSLDAPGGPE
jgi:hypothetical protein